MIKTRNNYSNLDLTDQQFGFLKVKTKKENTKSVWICDCLACGKIDVELHASRLLDPRRKSCGCKLIEIQQEFVHSRITHGDSKTRLFGVWKGIIDRCENPNIKEYKNYGGRGITMCEEWRNSFLSFKNWALNNGYIEGKNGKLEQSIDRIDVNKGYCPENCRWADSKVQSDNKTNNKIVIYNGERYSISKFCDAYGITDKSFAYRHFDKGEDAKTIIKLWNTKEDIPDYLMECSEYAEIHHITSHHVKRLINEGKIKGEKRGRKWYVLRK